MSVNTRHRTKTRKQKTKHWPTIWYASYIVG